MDSVFCAMRARIQYLSIAWMFCFLSACGVSLSADCVSLDATCEILPWFFLYNVPGSFTSPQPHWVAVGANGSVVYSSDQGQTWQAGNTGTAVHLYGIAYTGNNRWVAAGISGTTLISTDGGQTWFAGATLSGPPNVFHLAGDGNGQLLAVGTGALDVHFSTDSGVSWNVVDSRILASKTLAGYACNRWFVGSNADTSYADDGTSFTLASGTFSGTRDDVACNPATGRLAILSATGANCWYSDDSGNNWISAASGPTASRRTGIFLNGSFIAIGDNSSFSSSTDANTWNDSFVMPGSNYKSIRYGAGVLVAVGDGGEIAYSIDSGSSWTQATGLPLDDLSGVAFGVITEE